MKSQSDLHLAVIEDQLQLLGFDASRDLATMRLRIETRGENVLTLELPTLGQYLERGLHEGYLDPKGTPFFKRLSREDLRPVFLHDLFSAVFDSRGVLLDHPSTDAVRAVRQISYLHAKLKELPTDDKVEAALNAYVETDKTLSEAAPPRILVEEFRKTALRKWGHHFARMENFLYKDGFLAQAKHGPGAVAQKLTSNGKWSSREWTERLDREFRATAYLSHSLSYEGDEISMHQPGQEPPAKVTAVPKTAKGPRIITQEPVYNQFIQQGLSSLFEEWMFQHPEVSYEFQEPNQELAKAGSVDGSYATIDLSEASDRISLRIVKDLLFYFPHLLSAVLACRSQRSILPDGTIVLLRKFASMGSALTFPIETLVFATIAEMGIRRSNNLKRPKGSLLRVYGDDIIVPENSANETIALLEAFGLKVNTHKSFTKGNFRESCGGDFFHGVAVKPVRVRKRLPSSRSDADEVVSIVAFRNLYWQQYGPTKLVTDLDELIGGIIPFPNGHPDVSSLVRWDFVISPEGYDDNYHRPFVMAVRPVYSYKHDPLDGDAALLKFFWTPFQEDKNHLRRAGRPVSARLKYGRALL